jgi:hypothetical protein
VFPLYEYPPFANGKVTTDAPGGRRPNLAPEFITECEARWGLKFVNNGTGDLKKIFGPEDVFHYIYAVFHSPEYRRRYADFLKRDFPRVPLTSSKSLLRALCERGAKLAQLHLMNPSAVDISRFKLPSYPIPPTSTAPPEKGLTIAGGQADINLHSGGGGDVVEFVKYEPPSGTGALAGGPGKNTAGGGSATGKVWINKFQYFAGVAPEVFAFKVGGYQPCEKWLKDRKGRILSYDDQQHYKLVCAILAQTRDTMTAIDKQIDKHGGWPLG